MNPVLQAVARAALDATGAGAGWVLALEGDKLRAVGAAGEGTGELYGTQLPAGAGTAGYVVSSGQPIAIAPRGGDPRLGGGLGARLGKPATAVLCVPCFHDDAVVGALELVDKAGRQQFSYDDVELVTLLGGIAGAALGVAGPETAARPPAEFSAELAQLASSDPTAYARLSVVLEALLARG
ncbi:MAG TPA: GAF domain-containing protein, partial [Acidimicrobiales bacterium]|nr:GAF domain-containing protein [Acidimicrobiales bacterium]